MSYSRKDLEQLKKIKDYIPWFVPVGFLEIGSLDAADAKLISDFYKVDSYVIEPNPYSYQEILTSCPEIKSFNVAFSDTDGTSEFYAAKTKNKFDRAVSSLLTNKNVFIFNKVIIETMRGDTFFKKENLSVNFVKIDVEGFSYQVIDGFGDMIHIFDAIQIETEKKAIWENQVLDNEVNLLLESNGFKLVDRVDVWKNQYDSLYINTNKNFS